MFDHGVDSGAMKELSSNLKDAEISSGAANEKVANFERWTRLTREEDRVTRFRN